MTEELVVYRTAPPVGSSAGESDFTDLPLEGKMFDYLTTGDGVYLLAERRGLQVCIPVANGKIAGLAHAEPSVRFDYPRVPLHLTGRMLDRAESACAADDNRGREILFHLWYDEDGSCWQLVEPKQVQTRTSVRPVNDRMDSSYAKAMIEVHSHGQLSTFFSESDDWDEQGFRLYGVIGKLKDRKGHIHSAMLLRVGVYGNFYLFPAAWVFEMPENLIDQTFLEWKLRTK